MPHFSPYTVFANCWLNVNSFSCKLSIYPKICFYYYNRCYEEEVNNKKKLLKVVPEKKKERRERLWWTRKTQRLTRRSSYADKHQSGGAWRDTTDAEVHWHEHDAAEAKEHRGKLGLTLNQSATLGSYLQRETVREIKLIMLVSLPI